MAGGLGRTRNQVPKRAEHRQFVDALCAIEPQIAEASSVAREFLGLIHRRDVDGFDRWLVRARDGKATEIRRFAGSLTADLSAVRAAFNNPGVIRRKPVGEPANLSPDASRAFSIVIAILRLSGSRRTNLSRQRKRQFPLAFEVSGN